MKKIAIWIGVLLFCVLGFKVLISNGTVLEGNKPIYMGTSGVDITSFCSDTRYAAKRSIVNLTTGILWTKNTTTTCVNDDAETLSSLILSGGAGSKLIQKTQEEKAQ